MRQYKAQRGGSFQDIDSSTFIPDDMNNRHRVEMQAMIDAGEAEIIAADPVVPDTTPTPAEEIAALRKAVKGDMSDLEALDARR
jgi:hypothetical protein